ncbi:MAG: carbohydrate binding family 9 domain-containing protein [Ignavibacteriales bacterium]|nr:carbohydrate binding family 9 domain-containing protein [Ignavibacteriales bacterium]
MKIPLLFVVTTSAVLAGGDPKTARAVRTPTAPRIDGLLNEPEWQLASTVADFVQRDPFEGEQPTQKTEIRILYDDDAVYFGCTMYDTDPSKIVARLARRDDEILSDIISIRIDSYHDHQTAFEFTVNAAGVKVDILQYNDANEEDDSWDGVWDVETRITSEGWMAEIKIPFTVLRFPEKEEQEWGIQFIRRIARNREDDYWVLIRKNESGFISKFGHLVGIQGIRSPTNMELLPYTVGGGRFIPKSPGDPDGRDLTSNAGLDFKYKPIGGITVDATFNPDFGQVEADPAVLNLTTFEQFYPEKRPFFIEGTQILRFTTFGGDFGPGLFYSRRIGRAVSVREPSGGYVLNEPRFATILGAAKISGKTADGLSLGVLEAVTKEERASLVDATGARSDEIVEPLSNYSLLRLRQDVLGNSNVGAMLTSVNKRGRLPAFTGGVDWNLKFLENEYRVDGFLASSHTTSGLDQAIIIPPGQRITGSAGRLTVAKVAGEHWLASVSSDFTSKQFNINDIGFFRRPNDYGFVSTITYRDQKPTDWYRFWLVNLNYHLRKNFDGAELIHWIQSAGNLTFSNYWQLGYQVMKDWGKHDDRETRGNGLYNKPSSQSFLLLVGSDPRENIVGNIFYTVGSDTRKARFSSTAFEVELKPASFVTLEIEGSHSTSADEWAWVYNFGTSPDTTIFADRSTEAWDLTLRGTYVFTRDLTLQVYFQYFNAKYKYENFARMAAPDNFSPYTFPWPEFNLLSFNSNVVLRWEYLPGSTMYLVWSQARSGNDGGFLTPFRESLSRTFGLPGENALLLKISYWLSM